MCCVVAEYVLGMVILSLISYTILPIALSAMEGFRNNLAPYHDGQCLESMVAVAKQ